MNLKQTVGLTALTAALAGSAHATERLFTYSYEPETLPQGAWEAEQWFTLRAGRNRTVGQDNFQRWQFRSEAEYGVTDNYTVSLYVNSQYDNFRDPVSNRKTD